MVGHHRPGRPASPQGFLSVWPALQDEIHAADAAAGTPAAQQLNGYWDEPMSSEPLIGNVDHAAGHGTFIAGLIRQAAPDADVLAIRVMRSDGVARGAGVLCALQRIADRVRDAQTQGKPDQMIDIVSMSMGFFAESDNTGFKSRLTPIIKCLAEHGVLVVAAAGNHSTTRKELGAALLE